MYLAKFAQNSFLLRGRARNCTFGKNCRGASTRVTRVTLLSLTFKAFCNVSQKSCIERDGCFWCQKKLSCLPETVGSPSFAWLPAERMEDVEQDVWKDCDGSARGCDPCVGRGGDSCGSCVVWADCGWRDGGCVSAQVGGALLRSASECAEAGRPSSGLHLSYFYPSHHPTPLESRVSTSSSVLFKEPTLVAALRSRVRSQQLGFRIRFFTSSALLVFASNLNHLSIFTSYPNQPPTQVSLSYVSLLLYQHSVDSLEVDWEKDARIEIGKTGTLVLVVMNGSLPLPAIASLVSISKAAEEEERGGPLMWPWEGEEGEEGECSWRDTCELCSESGDGLCAWEEGGCRAWSEGDSLWSCEKCQLHRRCSSCSAVSGCTWLSLTNQSVCLPSALASAWASVTAPCPRPCEERRSCESCLEDESCGWCERLGSCHQDGLKDLLFPLNSCGQWMKAGSGGLGCGGCGSAGSCVECLSRWECGWCGEWEGECRSGAAGESLSCGSAEQRESWWECPLVDECETGDGRCAAGAECVDASQGYDCRCGVGFEGDGWRECKRTCEPACVHGSCERQSWGGLEWGGLECRCDVGWSGRDCGSDCLCNFRSACSIPGSTLHHNQQYSLPQSQISRSMCFVPEQH